MKPLLLASSAARLVFGASSRGDEREMPPNHGPKRDDWIFEHYTELATRQFDVLRLPKNYPKEAIHPIPPDLAVKIRIGTSFKVVLAMLGLPTEQQNETGGSGSVELPFSWWTYMLTDGSKMRLTFQFNRNFSDVVVTRISRNLSSKDTSSVKQEVQSPHRN